MPFNSQSEEFLKEIDKMLATNPDLSLDLIEKAVQIMRTDVNARKEECDIDLLEGCIHLLMGMYELHQKGDKKTKQFIEWLIRAKYIEDAFNKLHLDREGRSEMEKKTHKWCLETIKKGEQ